MHNEISDYLRRGIYPFHMPGHKGRADFFPPDFFACDLTELAATDILSAPTGIIKNFLEKISGFFCAEKSFFLTNGASAGIIAAINAVCDEKTPIFVPRNAHVSVYNALVFCGARPIYYFPEITADGLAGGVSSENFAEIPRGAVVFVVSPTYEGFVSDIGAIAETVHSRGGVLIVDEAHGAHFAFHEFFPTHALKLGADIVVNSLHKTLPAVSGCAVLHAKGGRVDLSRLQFFANAAQTTSPSFALMAACDFMLEKLWHEPRLFEKYVARIVKFRREFRSGGFELSGRERVGENAIFDIDEGKLLFSANAHNAEEISEIFAREYGVQFEMAKGRHLLAMTSVADTDEGFERLARPWGRTFFEKKVLPQTPAQKNFAIPEMVLTPREAMQSEAEEVAREAAVGRIAAELIADYPPGIAQIAPGERIGKVSKPYVRVVPVLS